MQSNSQTEIGGTQRNGKPFRQTDTDRKKKHTETVRQAERQANLQTDGKTAIQTDRQLEETGRKR